MILIILQITFAGAFQLYDKGSGKTEAQKLEDKVDRGEVDRFDSLKASLELYMRTRIRRQWEAEGQDCVFDGVFQFQREERAALETLNQANFTAGFLQ